MLNPYSAHGIVVKRKIDCVPSPQLGDDQFAVAVKESEAPPTAS